MYLKSIEIYGFKSFANKITFKFNDGITGIVGPNGSGKSNVGDAVRWVLGEQSAKQLRGAKMEDVIFSGTELRKPQGSAYVAITLDNSDHKLPIDYNEVTIARRVYRSGESEYLINGVVSRLKDVHGLFMDTGIGKEGYSIIGQGQVEKILSGKPEEKRELFDEAAGIVKYKKNKAATEKTLESERMNLARVNDILSELEKQVGPLKEQSETARRFLIYKDELKKLDINAFLLDVDANNEQLKELEDKITIVYDDIEELARQYDETKEEYDNIEASIESYDGKIESAKNEIHEKKLENQRFEGEVNVLNQQIISGKQNDESINEQIDKLNISLDKCKQELTKLYESKEELDEKLDNADDLLDGANSKYEEINNRIISNEKEIEDSKTEIIELLNEGGNLKAKVGRYDTMLENINLRKKELESRFLEIKSDEIKIKEEKELLATEIAKFNEEKDILSSELSSVQAKLADNGNKFEATNREVITFSNDIVSLKSKKEALRNLTERYDGYGNSIKKVMEKKIENSGIIGVIADIISVDKKYETAIETALGGNIKNIVTDNEDTAKDMIAYLKDNHLGRATFLPISSIVANTNVNEQALKEAGIVGIASKLVTCDSKYSAIIEYLLGRIYIADNIDNAIKISRKYKQSLRIVTTEGDLITPGGAMTGGSFKNASNLLGRKRELDELDLLIEEKTKAVATDKEIIKQLDIEREELKNKRDSLNDSIQQIIIKLNTYSLNENATSTKLEEITASFAKIKRENDELNTQIDDINNNKEQLVNNNKKQEDTVKELETKIAGLEEALVTDKEALVNSQEEINKLNIDFNMVKQQYEFNVENIKRIKTDENTAKEELLSLKVRLTGNAKELESISTQIEDLTKHIDENKRIIVIKEQKLVELTEYKKNLSEKHKEFFAKREELSEKLNGLDKSSYKLNAAMEKLSEKSESINNYMWEEYELTYNMAADYKDNSLTDVLSLKREISAVKGKIKELGSVNVNAIEDYKSVSERYEFLKAQHDDITKAEQNLLGIISELDRAMREQFAEKFQEIRLMFANVFKELFGGGKADLELVDDEDILESGIRIIAQPPGKKLQNMMQLSGGEKSLTAISLLFAIQSLKPSPFCLLDEIEAALDDSNVKRFAKYLAKLTKDTQFIVITHRRGTMEAADILYGITMQEKGVSTLVSVNMIEKDLDD